MCIAKKYFIFTALVFLAYCPLQAKVEQRYHMIKRVNKTNYFWEVYGLYTLPVGSNISTKSIAYNSGGGIGFEFFSKSIISKKTLLGFHLLPGGSFYYANTGSDYYAVNMHVPANAPGTEELNNAVVQFETLHRFIYNTKYFSPYIDVMEGFGIFYSNQTLTLNSPVKGYQSSNSWTMMQLGTFDYGASIGAMVRISDLMKINMNASYLNTYHTVPIVDFKNLTYDGHTYSPPPVQTMPTMVTFHIGFTFLVPNRSILTFTGKYKGSCPGGGYYGSGHSGGYFGGRTGGFSGGGGGGGGGMMIH